METTDLCVKQAIWTNTPWKSSLGSSYKPSGSSAYTSRDDIGSSRYSSLASPSTYRPSFSSGTYRIKRDPPSSLQTPSYTSRYTSNVPSRTTHVVDSSTDINGSKSSQLKRYTTTATGSISKYGSSREPSPAALEITNRMRSREPSPVSRALRGKSRDPSPVIDSSCKIGYGGLNSYRMSTPKPASTTSYNARYGSGTAIGRASTVGPSILPDKSISYLTASDFHARSASRARETARKSNEKELEEEVPAEQKKLEENSESESSSEEEEQETFISVSVVTRATSPTPPGSATTVQRTRRMDIAKTIEKTILRSTSKRATLEKEIQSDRLDDSTRYSRFGLSSRVPSYSPHSDNRYSSTNLRYSSSPLSSVSKSTASSVSTSSSAEPKKEVTASGGKTPRAAGNAKSKLSPPKAVRLSSRQSSVENLTANTNANKPPTAPKAESPTKSSSSSGHAPTKLPNKDFRKSALNVGPTDRPRKSRTPSSGTDSDAVQHAQNDVVNGSAQSKERSPSAGSEASNVSTTSSRRGATGENKARPRCHAKKSSSSASSLSRHNSCNNLKNNSHKLCSPSSSSTSSSTSAGVSSSSGAESSGEQKKINKKHGKKKNLNTHNKNHAANNSSVTKSATTGTGDSNDLTSQRAADENSKAAQPPPLLNAKEPRATQLEAAAEAAESSRTNSRSPLTSLQEKTSNRLQKLSSVSNFFVARQSDANSEPIFIESSENSGGDSETGQLIGSSLTAATNSNTSRITNATTTTTTSTDPASVAAAEAESATTISKRNCYNSSLDSTENTTARSSRSITKYSNESQDHSRSSETKSSSTNFPNETTVTETALTSEQGNDSYTTTATTSAEEQEESSWWQDTSRQINTASALGYHQKDDMRFKLRHIDSGETGWWLRNDEDDTLADDDLRTLNQEEEDQSEATTNPTQSLTNNTSTHSLSNQRNASQAKYSWWTSDNNDGDENEQRETANAQNENNQNETNCMAYYKANGEGKKIARSHCTPEKPWWGASNENSKGDDNSNGRLEKSNSSGKQNGTIQLKICRVESGEKPWWLSEPDKAQKDCDEEAVVEATIKLPTRKNNNVEHSSSSSKDVSDEKRWWMSGPLKKQFTVQRVESGERAWWQQNDEEEVKDQSPQRQKTNPDLARANSNEKIWWQNDNEENEPVKTSRVRALRSDSGEKDWWLQDNEGEEKIQNGAANHLRSEEWNEVASAAERGVDRTDTEVQHINGHVAGAQQQNFGTELSNSFNFEYSERPPPLGQCASPVALEQESPPQPPHPPVRNLNQCKSPYDNIPMSKVQVNHYYQPQYTQPLPTAQPLTPQPPYYQQPQQQQQHAQQTNDYYTPYGNNNNNAGNVRQTLGEKLFISRHQNIDELLGGSCRPLSPLFLDGSTGNSFSTVPANRNLFVEEITPDQVRIHDSTAQMPVIQRMERDEWDNYGGASATLPTAQYEQKLIDDAAIQVYKDGDYGAYLDLESSLAEQAEEIEGLNSSRKNSLVVRTQLSVRVHAIIEKLLSSEGSELRRALFSLKQVFQEDKDLVHAFVALGGLNCLVRVGNGADQNYQNYILRALGQVMLYVDGMNGVMKHEPTMQWLYSLIASNYRSVVKTALKLLLVFVEYAETNCYVLVNAIHAVDKSQGTLPWSNLMRLLKDYDNADAELVIYATSLINKTLAGLNDQDSFYDESDLLEQQGMESVIQRYMSKPGTDLDLLDQLQLYEAVLKFEDGEAEGIRLPENSLRKTQRHRQSTDTAERRKSRRHSTGTSPHVNKVIPSPKRITPTHGVLDEDSSGSTNSAEYVNGVFNGEKGRDSVGVTPGLRRRRERAERHKSFLKEQQEAVANSIFAALERREEMESDNEDKKLLQQLKRDHTVKDLTQKLSNMPMSPTHEEKLQNRIVGDMSGLISKAKEGLAKSKSKGEMSRSSSLDQDIKKVEPKKSENELHWEELVRNMIRPLNLCDLDFTDLNSEDEKDVLAPRGLGAGVPPPPPPFGGGIPPPMMPPAHIVCPPPMNSFGGMAPPPMFSYSGYGSMTNSANSSMNGSMNGDVSNTNTIKKNKKTVKLFWKEVREDMIPVVIGKTIWDELPQANVDIQKLEHLFESRAKDLMTKEKQQELNKSKEIIVLDHKRSNAINIAMTKLPPPRAIKAAILKMDATVVTREGIDKLLNMLPTDEERGKIQEAQMANPELPLGSAEQFLLTLASISELGARLKLWAFRLDFDNSEKEIAEPLMDLKQGIEILRNNRTFKCILSTLLSVGIFLNGAPVKGFQIEYLSKVPEVKDTVHKHSLLHHLCHMVMESSPDTTDLYSEIGPITRASKADFSDLAHNLNQLETECKASWDRLKLIAKHDCPPQLKQKLVDFLADCAERIIILQIVHRRVINRYRKFLLWLGVPQHSVVESKPNEFCRILSEFALEYRTTRERVQQQLEKKANHRERNKTRGKLIIDMAKFKTKEDRADAELKVLLGTPSSDTADGTLTWRRRRAENLRSPIARQSEENFTDGDDEILESLVKTATKAPGTRTTPRERKRTRHADRKSLRRTLKNGLTEEEKQHVAALIKTY
ncbi:uncharacterized protein LOC128862087 isoform X6 [Anastrepha ludens]|uniref:uncharacterized protein LOC128862087 isoform X6 n=1 Tax=Anastrepha ludens TaxID=28586 RepID=UPI0023B07504|nr:uncharacterized protein LOC128862087 isoform X6 [Anastrepha ludens]